MKHKIEITDPIAKVLHNLGMVDVDSDKRPIVKLIEYLKRYSIESAINLCNDQTVGADKEYDRGFVAGILSVVSFMERGREAGRNLIGR